MSAQEALLNLFPFLQLFFDKSPGIRMRNNDPMKIQRRRKTRTEQRLDFELLEPRCLLNADIPGVTVTETHIITQNDTVPRFVANPTDVAIRNGNWSDPNTWADGTVPTREDLVRVDEGILVQFDTTTEIDSLEIIGQLEFTTEQDTSLLVTTITVLPSGSLTIGTADNPIADAVSVNVVFRDVELQTGTVDSPGIDPSQYGNGLLVFGEFTTHGADKTPYVRATGDIVRGDTSIQLSSVPDDWQVGDTLLLPQTSQSPILKRAVDIDETEEVTILAINGNTIEFETAVRFDHLGIAENPFSVERYAHIGNLTRNVIFQSENGEGVRGHVFLTATAVVDVDNTSFIELGRTRAEFITNNTVVDEAGQVLRIGENQAGRYSFHSHHLTSPFELSGSVVEDGWRWGITVHNTDNSLIENNIVYEAAGAGIVTVSGTETGNVFTGNLVIKVEGGHQVGDQRGGVTRHRDDLMSDRLVEIAVDGSAFWFRSTAGTIENNFVYDAAGYGYNFNGYYNRVDATPGLNVEQIDSFQNNEVASSFGGLWLTWSQGQANIQENYQRQTFEDLLIWHTQTGVETYHDGRFTLSDVTVIGDAAVSATNEGSASHPLVRSSIGIHVGHPNYENFDIRLEGVRVSGQNVGYTQSRNAGDDGTLLRDAVFANYINLLFREADHQEQLTTENVSFLASDVPRIANSFPDTVANRFAVDEGTIEAGTLSDTLPVPLSLPSDISIRDGVLRITGSDSRDEITIIENEDDLIIVNRGVESIIPRADVSSYFFRAGDGDDLFENRSSLPGTVLGGNGDDILIGGSGTDVIRGEDGNDRIDGGDGDDLIYGDEGDDVIQGGHGEDRLRGGDGADTIEGGHGNDLIDGNAGNDKLYGGFGNDRILGGLGDDDLFGEDGNDLVRGGDGDDLVRGGLGDDILYGDEGRDEVFGDDGSDRIRGGLGEDRLYVDLNDLLLDTNDDEVI